MTTEAVCFRCRRLETIDLTECSHLMHPLVFKVWDNLTCNMTSVSLESTTATDDIVHVSFEYSTVIVRTSGQLVQHVMLSQLKIVEINLFFIQLSECNNSVHGRH